MFNIFAGLAMNGKRVLLVDIGPQGDLTKMLGQHRPHDLLLTLDNVMNDMTSLPTSPGAATWTSLWQKSAISSPL